MNTNKYGVPYHSFVLTLEGAKRTYGKSVNIGYEEDWGNITDYIDQTGHKGIGYGNDEDGYDEVLKVWDCEAKVELEPFEWYDTFVTPYIDCYSC